MAAGDVGAPCRRSTVRSWRCFPCQWRAAGLCVPPGGCRGALLRDSILVLSTCGGARVPAIMPRYGSAHEPDGSKAPAAHRNAFPRWLECCTPNIARPPRQLTLDEARLNEQGWHWRARDIFSPPPASCEASPNTEEPIGKVRADAVTSERSPRRARRNTNRPSQTPEQPAPEQPAPEQPTPEQPTRHTHHRIRHPGASARQQPPHPPPATITPNISRSKEQPHEGSAEKLTRRRQGAWRENPALESQQEFCAEPLIDAAAASVASGALLTKRGRSNPERESPRLGAPTPGHRTLEETRGWPVRTRGACGVGSGSRQVRRAKLDENLPRLCSRPERG